MSAPAPGTPGPPDRGGDGALGVGMIVLGLGLALTSLLGPLAGRAIEYPLSRTLTSQTLGLEAVSLLVAAPLAVAAGALALRRHPAAPVLALAPALYSVYMLAQYVVGPDYVRLSRAVPFHLGLFVLAEVMAVRAWRTTDPELLARRGSPSRDLLLAAALLLLSLFVFLRYLPALTGAWSGEPIPAEARDDPAMFWTIFLLDLGVAVPASVAAAAALLRTAPPWARKAAYGLVGWFALVGVAVGAMGVAMYLDADPNATVGSVALLGTTGLLTAAFALWAHRPLFGGPEEG